MDTSVIWFGEIGVSIRTLLRGIAILFVLAALPLSYAGWLQERQLTIMRTQTTEVAATVVSGKDDVQRTCIRLCNTSHTYYLTLDWADAEGQVLTATREVSGGLFHRAMKDGSPAGQKITLRYLPGRPDVPTFIPSEINDQFNAFGAGAIALLVAGLGLAWLAWPPRRSAALA